MAVFRSAVLASIGLILIASLVPGTAANHLPSTARYVAGGGSFSAAVCLPPDLSLGPMLCFAGATLTVPNPPEVTIVVHDDLDTYSGFTWFATDANNARCGAAGNGWTSAEAVLPDECVHVVVLLNPVHTTGTISLF